MTLTLILTLERTGGTTDLRQYNEAMWQIYNSLKHLVTTGVGIGPTNENLSIGRVTKSQT